MARPRATESHREEVRLRIRDAAAELYNTQGTAAISARSVALKAGVSVGTLYAHFGDLTGVMQSLWTERIEQQNADFSELVLRHEDPLDRLSALLTAYLAFGFQNTNLYESVFLFAKPGTPLRNRSAPLDATDFPALLTQALIECQASGEVIDGDPATLAQILWSGVHGCLALPAHINRHAFASADALAAPMVGALVRAVRIAP